MAKLTLNALVSTNQWSNYSSPHPSYTRLLTLFQLSNLLAQVSHEWGQQRLFRFCYSCRRFWFNHLQVCYVFDTNEYKMNKGDKNRKTGIINKMGMIFAKLFTYIIMFSCRSTSANLRYLCSRSAGFPEPCHPLHWRHIETELFRSITDWSVLETSRSWLNATKIYFELEIWNPDLLST